MRLSFCCSFVVYEFLICVPKIRINLVVVYYLENFLICYLKKNFIMVE